MNFHTFEHHQLKFTDGYCDFNGNMYILNKTKENHKYYVYSKETGERIKIYDADKMTILESAPQKNFQILFYVDSHNYLSFIKAKKHKVLTGKEIIDKVEKTPFFRVNVFSLFQTLFFFGVLRFRSYSFKDIELSFGYDKSMNVKVNYLFPQKIRSKFAMSTSKPLLFIHFFWCRIPFRDLYQYYLENSSINVPAFIKVKNQYFNYYYSLKMRTKDKYNQIHYVYNTFSHLIRNTLVEFFVRKSITGQFVIVFTTPIKKRIKMLEKLAYFCSYFFRNKNRYNVYFEKFCEGASESGFELFKQAVKNDRNSVFILSMDNDKYKELKTRFPKNVVAKNSYKAFLRIFLAHSFISSDLVTH